jgi:hypothetical protein
MTRYVQAIELYLALFGFALRELAVAEPFRLAMLSGGLLTAVNGLAIFAATRFRSMTLHAMERECVLAEELERPRFAGSCVLARLLRNLYGTLLETVMSFLLSRVVPGEA